MNEFTPILIMIIWALTVFIAFMAGGAMGTGTGQQIAKSKMVCSKCGHRG